MSYAYAYSSDVWPALITLSLAIYLGIYSWRRRDIPAARPFGATCPLGGIWTLGTILEISALEFATKVFWEKFQAIWQLPVAATMTCFVLQYAGLGRWLTRCNYILLFLFPLLSVSMMVTNDYHHLIWAGFRISGHAVASPGKLFWVFFSYIYLLGIVNFVVLVRLAIFSPGHRLPIAIRLSGHILARIGYTLDKIEAIGPGEIDATPNSGPRDVRAFQGTLSSESAYSAALLTQIGSPLSCFASTPRRMGRSIHNMFAGGGNQVNGRT